MNGGSPFILMYEKYDLSELSLALNDLTENTHSCALLALKYPRRIIWVLAPQLNTSLGHIYLLDHAVLVVYDDHCICAAVHDPGILQG